MNISIDGAGREISSAVTPRGVCSVIDPRLAQRLSRITSAQRDCLQLVLEHKTSKDIALVLGISPHAVDKRLKAAAHILEVDGRLAAAKLVRDHDQSSSGYQRLAYRSPDLVEHPLVTQVEASHRTRSLTDEPISSNDLHDVAASAELAAELRLENTLDRTATTITVPWGALNTLRIGQRLLLILLIAVLSAVAFASIISSFETLRHLL